MVNRAVWVIIALLVITAAASIGILVDQRNKIGIIGGDKTNEGCLIGAGYSWNETEKECVREWARGDERYQINNFEQCEDAEYPLVDIAPRTCKTPGGRIFVENIRQNWTDDGIILMQNNETGEYACFGCNNRICVDPAPIMAPVEESESIRCTQEFEVIRN